MNKLTKTMLASSAALLIAISTNSYSEELGISGRATAVDEAEHKTNKIEAGENKANRMEDKADQVRDANKDAREKLEDASENKADMEDQAD